MSFLICVYKSIHKNWCSVYGKDCISKEHTNSEQVEKFERRIKTILVAFGCFSLILSLFLSLLTNNDEKCILLRKRIGTVVLLNAIPCLVVFQQAKLSITLIYSYSMSVQWDFFSFQIKYINLYRLSFYFVTFPYLLVIQG